MSDTDDKSPEDVDQPLPGLPDADWADDSTDGFSSPGTPPDFPPDDIPDMDSDFGPHRADGEPDTVFDASAPRPPREMKIAPEGDGRKLPAGFIINERFEIRQCLGEGNVGTVYLVDDLRLKGKKALKLMHASLVDSDVAAERFISEIKVLQRLSHEHIVRVYDYGKTERGELSFFTMEYIDGISLAGLLKKKGGRVPLEKALPLIRQILDTLEYAHQHTTHRNLKPINIMVRPTGHVVLLNFGISTTASSAGLAPAQRKLGASPYQSPEQREHPETTDPRVDIYAAGAILYQMLTGNVPLNQPPRPGRLVRGVPRRLDRVIMKSIAPRPDHRYPDAATMKQTIDRAVAPVSPWRHVLLLAAAAGLALAVWWLLGGV